MSCRWNWCQLQKYILKFELIISIFMKCFSTVYHYKSSYSRHHFLLTLGTSWMGSKLEKCVQNLKIFIFPLWKIHLQYSKKIPLTFSRLCHNISQSALILFLSFSELEIYHFPATLYIAYIWRPFWILRGSVTLKSHKNTFLKFTLLMSTTGLGFFRKKPISSGTPGKKWKKPISSSFVRTKLEETGQNWERCQICWKKIIIILNLLQKIICIWLITFGLFLPVLSGQNWKKLGDNWGNFKRCQKCWTKTNCLLTFSQKGNGH